MTTIHITHTDHKRLSDLLKERRLRREAEKTDEFLSAELARAELVNDEAIAPDVVTMHSKVRFVDADDGESRTYWLVLPEEADVPDGKLSVLSPIGSALIGYRAGDTFTVTAGPRTRTLRVDAVLHQPEAHGSPN